VPTGEKILITGPAGQIAFPLARSLAADNEVWGIARFGDPEKRRKVEDLGVTTRRCDLATGDFSEVPDDFTYVVHLAAYQEPGLDYDQAIRQNAEATGLLLAHCRRARGALVMSTHSVYEPNDDALHVYAETDPLGDVHSSMSPTYSVSKIAQEAVARTCARQFDLPVVIARMNASYGDNGGLPVYHLDAVMAGEPVTTRWDPCSYSPIHEDDINEQTVALLATASVPARVVNFAGDEAVSVQEWCAYLGELTGRPARVNVAQVSGTLRGSIASTEVRRSLAGPCKVSWREGLRRAYEARYGPGAARVTRTR
jgi:nucleoside-diphosphate-sugar epimerase